MTINTALEGPVIARLIPLWKPRGRFGYAYDVELHGELIVAGSRDPEHDACRALQARGITGKLQLIDGNTGKPRTRIDIEAGAKWRVSEEDTDGLRLRRWCLYADIRPQADEMDCREGETTGSSLRLSQHARVLP